VAAAKLGRNRKRSGTDRTAGPLPSLVASAPRKTGTGGRRAKDSGGGTSKSKSDGGTSQTKSGSSARKP
jgi:hypothetical protein